MWIRLTRERETAGFIYVIQALLVENCGSPAKSSVMVEGTVWPSLSSHLESVIA
jgi:hypothetical protein